MSVTQLLVNGLVGFLLPILVGIVTRWTTRSAAKAVLLLLLSAVSGFLTSWAADPGVHWSLAALYAGEAWVVAVASHFGLWKPGGVTATRP
jgi:hypothetical protein